MQMRKIMCGLTLVIIGLVWDCAYAGSFGPGVSHSVGIVVEQQALPLTLSTDVTPNLIAGPLTQGKVIATTTVHDAKGRRIGVRYSRETPQVSLFTLTTLTGKEDPGNDLKLSMRTPLPSGEWKQIGSNIYFVENTMGDVVITTVADGAQVIKADTYVLGLDAAIYNP